MTAFISRHRKCGCDCRDSDVYHPDSNVFNPLFDIGCSGAVKPPCKYYARFECVFFDALDPTHYIFEPDIPLRQTCEFDATLGQYTALFFIGSGGTGVPVGSFHAAELVASVPYACTWMDRNNPTNTRAASDAIYAAIRWTLDTSAGTFTHINGITYALPTGTTWDCFGPNTLRLSGTTPANQKSVPQSVCITPEIERNYSQPGCCTNCYETTISAIQQGDSYFMPQRLEWMPVARNAPDYNPNYACQYKAFVKLYVSTTDGFSGNVTTCFYGQQDLSAQFGSQLNYARLFVQNKTDSGTASPAIIKIYYQQSCNATTPIEAIYECDAFDCNGGTFNHSTNDSGFPTSISVTARECYYEEVNDWGMVYNCEAGGGYIKDPNRPTYGDETSRYHCCDPWGACAPGSIQILCPSRGTQKLTGCFCTGGHTGLNSPKGPSRELCGTFTATDGTTHTICAVVYCGDGSAWTSDWYCDGSHVGTGSGGSVSCCPMQFRHSGPSISCLPGCTVCLGVNIEPDCVAPQVCCADADETNCHVTLTSTCGTLNGVSILMTRVGSHTWTGTGPSGFGASMNCGLTTPDTWTLVVSKTFDSAFVMTSTNVSCSGAMSGTYAAVASSSVFNFTCAITDTCSAVVSP